ncbi:asparagine synthetase [Candidatus Scalindua japonica]|uniref:asparagine synthase (glutamine-hydrolyzing) n=1 Tax=Candidatus Scalindua japonica TaxID=1284222 RepID=A0A286TWW0_9BACT|nr:asparagine synthase (glutamine-hydrolyzing) [Candidatus Scalindua japonica]GAX60368.1 asparagine synthetase [Candidatus Scalindua japonica]
MCGIAGIICKEGNRLERNFLENMTNALKHRGPDDQGIYINRNLDQNGQSDSETGHSKVKIGLGHRRLSIIDVSENGRQPMANENETVWISYNGEIYNYRELKNDLIPHGHVFRSNSDTEVIIHGYEQYGEEIFNKLNGMFALGLWDAKREVLYLVRDRYGQKPLYYWHTSTDIAFSSELKSLTKYPYIKKEIDIHSLSRYLSYEYIPAPHSIIKDVKKLLPGHFLRWEAGNVQIKQYWQIQFNGTEAIHSLSLPEIEHQLVDMLKRSVERRLISDVPLGVFLSGGIDSSCIVALMSELMSTDQIKTFSIGFEEESFDESNYAKSVSRLFGTTHHEQILTPEKMIKILPEVWDFIDEPFADASIIPTYLLSKFTREHVTVALGGDGGDELFAGYDSFQAHVISRYYEKIPGFLHNFIAKQIIPRIPVSINNMSLDFRMKQFLKGISYKPSIRNQVWLGSFTKEEQKGFLSEDINHIINGSNPYDDISQALDGMKFRDSLDEIIFCYSHFYLANDILTKIDRASMATSLEARSPFLDVEFAEFVNNLPSKLKLRGLARKYILKRSLKNKLPKEILFRKKKGFGVPLAKWFKKELKQNLLEVLSPSRIRKEGLFNADAITVLLNDHFSGRKDNRKYIWTLFMFEMWKEKFINC